MLERRGGRATGDLSTDGEGAFRRAPTEARCHTTAPDPGGVSQPHGRRPPLTAPRPHSGSGQLAAAAPPANGVAGAASNKRQRKITCSVVTSVARLRTGGWAWRIGSSGVVDFL